MPVDDDYRKQLSTKSDKELLMIVRRSRDYVPEAVEAVLDELRRRGHTPEAISSLASDTELFPVQRRGLAWWQIAVIVVVLPDLARSLYRALGDREKTQDDTVTATHLGLRSALTSEQVARIGLVHDAFQGVDTTSYDSWVDQIARAPDPEMELRIHEAVADAYRESCQSRTLLPDARIEVLNLLRARTTRSEDQVIRQLQVLSESEVREVLARYVEPRPTLRQN